MSPAPFAGIDLVLPELFARPGGIQRYSLTLIQALREVRPTAGLRVFIRNDHPGHLPAQAWPGVQWYPCRGSNLRLARALWRSRSKREHRLLICTHLNLSPLLVPLGLPLWISAHGIEAWELSNPLHRWAIRRSQRLLPVSRFTSDRLQQLLGSSCPPLSLLPNCVDVARFSPGPRPIPLLGRYGLHPQQPLLLTLTRLSRADRYKHIDALIRALPPLLQQWPDLRLMVIGDGDDRPRLQRIAQDLGLTDAVIFTGALPDQELVAHYRLATVFALPSEKEGFGIVFLEALACGLPVLAGNRDGSVDPLADGAFGLLVDPRLPLAPPLHALLQRQGDPLWFQPANLAQVMAERFSFSSICRILDQLLTQEELC